MKRRNLLMMTARAGLALSALGFALRSVAQRPAHPIYRPRPDRPDRPLVPGRLPDDAGGVAGSAPGVFTVRSVRTRDNIVQLADDGGHNAEVHVDPDVFDLSALQPGDRVEVDFLVPHGGEERLAASGVWKIESARK